MLLNKDRIYVNEIYEGSCVRPTADMKLFNNNTQPGEEGGFDRAQKVTRAMGESEDSMAQS